MTPSGLISGTPTVSGTFSYTVTVSDGNGHTGTSTCSVTVAPAPPVVANCANITANQGAAITPVQLTATGGVGSSYAFSATGLPAGITMTPNGLISGTPTVSGTFSYTVTVNDGKGHTGTSTCSVTVEPPPVVANCANITAAEGVAITPVQLTATGGAGSSYTFSATGLPAGITMTAGGLISGTPTVSGTFSYTVTVSDGKGHTSKNACSVTIAPAPPVVANCANISANQGVAITPVQLTATGGVGSSYTFSATGLPAGITMTPNGLISGTPAVSGTFSYTVTVNDGKGHTGTGACSVSVNAPVTANCVALTAVQGVAITPVTLTASGGAGAPYTFTASGLPAGLTMSTSGTISGTPTVSGTFAYTVTVKDKNRVAGTVNCSVTVTTPPTGSNVSAGDTATIGF